MLPPGCSCTCTCLVAARHASPPYTPTHTYTHTRTAHTQARTPHTQYRDRTSFPVCACKHAPTHTHASTHTRTHAHACPHAPLALLQPLGVLAAVHLLQTGDVVPASARRALLATLYDMICADVNSCAPACPRYIGTQHHAHPHAHSHAPAAKFAHAVVHPAPTIGPAHLTHMAVIHTTVDERSRLVDLGLE